MNRIHNHAFLLAILGLVLPCAADTIFVDDTAPPNGDGATWSSAFTDLQDALDTARLDPAIDAIHVADGVYRPDRGTLDEALSFDLVDGVALLGGFPDGGGPLNQRDRDLHPTMLSGDLLNDDGPLLELGQWIGMLTNSQHIVQATNCGPTTRLDGFIIRGGNADNGTSAERVGANVQIHGGGPVIADCRIERGRSDWGGGGIGAVDATPLIEHCEFFECSSNAFGGGIGIFGSLSAEIRACRFENNIGGSGTGVYCGPLSANSGIGNASSILKCEFTNNNAVLGASSGGGVHFNLGDNRLIDCTFIDNMTDGGGGVGVRASDAWIERCTFLGNRGDGDGGGAILAFNFDFGAPPTTINVVSCLMAGNNGGISAINTNVNLINCTIAHNQIPGKPAFLNWPAVFSQDAVYTISNSIVWGHVDLDLWGGVRDFLAGAPLYTVSNSVIEQWDGTLPGTASAKNPGFVDDIGPDGDSLSAMDNNYALRLDSPCLDAGNNLVLPIGAMLDLIGQPRSKDGDANGVSTVDIGAIERCTLDNTDDECERLGDLTGDGLIDTADIAPFVTSLLNGTGSTLADINRDGAINGADASGFVELFLSN